MLLGYLGSFQKGLKSFFCFHSNAESTTLHFELMMPVVFVISEPLFFFLSLFYFLLTYAFYEGPHKIFRGLPTLLIESSSSTGKPKNRAMRCTQLFRDVLGQANYQMTYV
jgi:hypothetical protein